MSLLELIKGGTGVIKVEERELTVAFPLSAIAKAEAAIGRDLKDITRWYQLKWEDELPQVLHAGFAKFHPEATLEDAANICESLTAEGLQELHRALIRLNFPKRMQELEADWERRAAGKTSPNGESGAGR